MTLCCQISSALLGDSGNLPGFLSDWAFSAASSGPCTWPAEDSRGVSLPATPRGRAWPILQWKALLHQRVGRGKEAWAGADVSSQGLLPSGRLPREPTAHS